MKKILMIGVALAGCATNSAQELETALTAAEKLGTVYVQLPLCTPIGPKACSVAEVSAQIKAADNKAYTAVKLYEGGGGSEAAALTAIQSLSATVPTGATP